MTLTPWFSTLINHHFSTKSKYWALLHTIAEIIWLCWFLYDQEVLISLPTNRHESVRKPSPIDIVHERTKHVQVDCHFVRQKTIQLFFICLTNQVANLVYKKSCHTMTFTIGLQVLNAPILPFITLLRWGGFKTWVNPMDRASSASHASGRSSPVNISLLYSIFCT